MADVVLHVGLPKTGTTSIQSALERHAQELADVGVLFPGGRHHAHRLAAYDLLGQRVQGDDHGAVAGAFARLVTEIDGYDGDRVVVSEEELGIARPRHVRRVAQALQRHRLFVVIGVRDLGRTLVSAWQQGVLMGSTASWRDFIEAVRDPEYGDLRVGTSFRLRHDPLRVLDVWGTCVPTERIALFTVPPPGSTAQLLLERFADAAGLPFLHAADSDVRRNSSPGPAEVEAVRRLNASVVGPLSQRDYRFVVERGIRPGLNASRSRPLQLSRDELGWVQSRSDALVAEISSRGHRVHGDLQDLQPTEAIASTRGPDDVATDELLAATEATVVSLALALGSLNKRYRRSLSSAPEHHAKAAERVASSTRAAAFRLQKAALSHARHNRLLKRAIRSYLR